MPEYLNPKITFKIVFQDSAKLFFKHLIAAILWENYYSQFNLVLIHKARNAFIKKTNSRI